MNKLITFVAALGSTLFFPFASVSAGTKAADGLTLASAGWSVKTAHNFASNPPPLDAVQAFERRAFGADPDLNAEKVCAFRFADLRHSENLSLVVSVDGGGTGGCNITYIFDKTATGFEIYSSWARFYGDDDIQGINHDGKQELILWGPIASADEIGEECEWPIVFAWSGSSYTEVGVQYKSYYERYLQSLNQQLAAYSSRAEQAPAPTDQTPEAGRRRFQDTAGTSGGEAPLTQPEPSSPQVTEAAPTPNPADYACHMVEAANTERFLGIDSDTKIMAAAIKDSESADEYDRMVAAVLFSFMKAPEAVADLKTLADDTDEDVARTAKGHLSFSDTLYPDEYYRQIKRESVDWPHPGL
jgi:hypothetical protein